MSNETQDPRPETRDQRPEPRQMFRQFELVQARDVKVGDVVAYHQGGIGGLLQFRAVVGATVDGEFVWIDLANGQWPALQTHSIAIAQVLRLVS